MAIPGHDFTLRLLTDAGISSGMRVLDVGCGSGDVALIVSQLVGGHGRVIGVDHDDAALAIARQRAALSRIAAEFVQGRLADLPDSIGTFDAIVGRRVLMYQADTIGATRALARHLRPGGVMVFQEHDTTMAPASLDAFPLHRKAQGWVREMIAREGADLHIGFNLHRILTNAGLTVESVRAECLVQTPDAPYGLGHIVRACLMRIVSLGVATADEVDIENLQSRLDEERAGSDGIYVGDVMFGAWARMQ